ncbi:MAG: reverse transcriptase domain-containing protein, partial [Dehalococcoidia bacterium]|nr:reverse transcriptase domain-containing protein [Dehalococcoidia bacterium]
MRGVNEALSKTCGGTNGKCTDGRPHASCTGRRAEKAAIYPLKLCRAIINGIHNQLLSVGWMHEDAVGVMFSAELHSLEEMPQGVAAAGAMRKTGRPQSTQRGGRTFDALTKQVLDEDLVVEGKTAEMEFIRQWKVYDYADYAEAQAETGRKPISTRWVCTNKGDDMAPNVRRRWVARYFRDEQDVIFAATAPYESIRLLLSIAAAKEESKTYKGQVGGRRLQVSLVDIKRAYFNAAVAEDQPIFVELPPEDPEYGRKCGRLRRHLYGTRGAAAGWEEEYSAFLQEVGFTRGLASGCLFYHPGRDLRVAVYGDDFTIVGSCQEIDWLETAMEARYAITKRGRLGSSPEDCKELMLLNRIVRWVDGKGVEVEADPRQAERLVAQLGLTGANPLTTPGVKPTVQELETDDLIYDERGKVYQGGSARGNYMGLDRPETQFAVKECCRWMSAPTELALRALKRVGRFVEGQPRLVLKMNFENTEENSQVDVYVDSDYAGCPRTRKSTSGGCVMMGTHLIKSWSSTQNNAISLSSGEAELYAAVKGVGVGMGVQQYLRDLGMDAGLRVHTDSSAAQGICKRVGLGTQRHIA